MPPLATPYRATGRIIRLAALVSHDRCFLAGSQARTHAWIEGRRPGEGE